MRASRPVPAGSPLRLAALAVVWAAVGCERGDEADLPQAELNGSPQDAEGFVRAAIERHGGPLYDHARTTFTFRDAEFEVRRDGGLFRYERRYTDEEGRTVVEVMDNDGTRMEVDGEEVELDAEELARVETDVNSVVYFSFLPFRLMEPAVRQRDLGGVEVEGEPYRMIEVTFDPEGGGSDWEDRFVHWIHRDEHTLDYFAYRYHRDGGGSRFRRAVNRRELDGLLIQDFENYRAADEPVDDIAEYGRLMEEGEVVLLSDMELEDVRVEPLR